MMQGMFKQRPYCELTARGRHTWIVEFHTVYGGILEHVYFSERKARKKIARFLEYERRVFAEQPERIE